MAASPVCGLLDTPEPDMWLSQALLDLHPLPVASAPDARRPSFTSHQGSNGSPTPPSAPVPAMDATTSLPGVAPGARPSRLDRLARTRLLGRYMPARRHRGGIAGVLALAAETLPGDDHLPESADFRAMLQSYLSSGRPSVRWGNAILDIVSARLAALDRVDDALAALRLPLPGGAYCEEWDEAAWLRAARGPPAGPAGAGVPELYRDWQAVLATAGVAFHTRPAQGDVLPISSGSTRGGRGGGDSGGGVVLVGAGAVEFTRPLRFVAASLAECGAPASGPEARAVVRELRRAAVAYGRRRGRARCWSLRYLHRELPPHEADGYSPWWKRWARAVGCGFRRSVVSASLDWAAP
ncbi:hypothetical protein GGTG_02082 [Gaeumannomyces tritici R3-111a-1]|uniref:Uncharacterized protein n=1 Tax=Gaeumannomyces tritici (strain R3-111a-1) TaxID=644352 RepID=J3NLD4_GAET3|nr:hypothetical protein GGTG_02082 [Gaeumannomyces tritici R3-111a-1]EJT82108.1 hypothetical protein GGTG_02082 [Gaeumannomyces tritici R3-111a-1]